MKITNLQYPVSINKTYKSVYAKGRKPFRSKTTEANDYASLVAWEFKSQNREHVCNADKLYRLTIIILPKLTKKGVPSEQLIDSDAPIKLIKDALQGVCYENDKQVVGETTYYGQAVENGGCIVKIEEVFEKFIKEY